jgi:catechol 2,3-dioxygenase-like lactoylglutathione lyase family enzyme
MASATIDHIGLSVSDYDAAKRFYSAALQPLGLRLGREFPNNVTADFDVGMHGPGGQTRLIVAGAGKARPPVHLAFTASSRAVIDASYVAAPAADGRDNGPPDVRAHYHANYYAAFVFDPDGNNIEAVTHQPE